ncbi:MAG: DUF1553 domain-containing protein [Gemmataceae bacterium]
MSRRFAAILAVIATVTGTARTHASDADPKAEFFEKKIRPVLVEHCYACHSAEAEGKKKLRGGLKLDTKDAVLAGGDSGAAIAPGKPAESLLLKSMKYDGDIKMPPKGKLPDAVIADFEKWLKDGAVDPRKANPGTTPGGSKIDLAKGREFWAYKPVAPPAVPATKDPWATSDIDRLILAKLVAKGLKPAPDADRATLARRLHYDLTGMPPTPEQVDAFVKDSSSDAYEKLVEKLLASPAFGERWGRHWLDTARYADSVTLRGFVFKEAWRYRDYVIDSFNRDMPFNQFIREQIAGDLLPAATPADRTRQIVATTYLMLGNTNLEEQDKKQLRMDVIDEQLDVITKGMLAQTVTCARCHDHKFDPIPTKDYYALAGILRNVKALKDANVSQWIEVPLPAAPEVEAAVKTHAAEVADLQARIKTAKAKLSKNPDAPATFAKGVLAVKDVPGIVVDDAQAMKVGEWKTSTFNNTYIGAGYTHDGDAGKGEKTLTFDPEVPATGKYEVWLAYSPGGNRADKVPVTVFSADGEKTLRINMKDPPPIEGRFVSLGQYRFEKTGQSFVLVANEGTKGHVTADAVTFIPAEEAAKLTAKPLPKDKDAKKDKDGDTADLKKLAAMEAELKKLQANPPKRPMAMSVVEEPKAEDTRVHIRGSVNALGEVAPRGFLQVATLNTPSPLPKDQSGRVQLADWLASKENPLTARVYANRAWHWLFGSGIVRTVDNFGTTGELPIHPELLDHLANQFVAEGWSVKKLVRSIVLSHTYRQSSVGDANAVVADPENRLFGRANRRRLEAEAIRDTILTISGKLSAAPEGAGFPPSLASDYAYKHNETCRSVYVPVFRNSLPEVFDAFDFPDPSLVSGRRNSSTVAPQALFMMNNPFVISQAKLAAERLLGESHPDDDARITRAYRLTVGREPTAGERSVAAKFLRTNTDAKAAWAALFQVLFASADFRFVE